MRRPQQRDHREQYISYREAERLLDEAFGWDSQDTYNKEVRGTVAFPPLRESPTRRSVKFVCSQFSFSHSGEYCEYQISLTGGGPLVEFGLIEASLPTFPACRK